jgi:membrane-bound serine protease (ClpP class)
MLFNAEGRRQYMVDINPGWWVLIAIVSVFLIVIIVLLVLRTYRNKIGAGREELIGKTAEVAVALCPKGVVLIEGERWTAIVDKGQVEPGEEVIITKVVDGLKLIVTKKEKRS